MKWRSLSEGFNSEIFVFLNDLEFIKYIQETNLNTPSFVGNLQVKDLTNLKYFLGLETDTSAVLRVGHALAGREVRDFLIQCDLRGSNTLNTKLFWRSDLNTDIQSAIKSIGNMLGYLNLDRTWLDLESILDILHEKIENLADDLNILTNMELKLFFKPLSDLAVIIREVTDSKDGLTKSLVEYYVGGIEYFCLFW